VAKAPKGPAGARMTGDRIPRIAGQSQKNRVGTLPAAMLSHGAIGSLVLGAMTLKGRVTPA
jgi:hypothetical protein